MRANIGLDSGDEVMLRRIKGRDESVAQNLDAVRLLKGAGLTVYASFVLGGPGETAESLARTRRFVAYLCDSGVIDAVEVQPLFPELNARAGRILLDRRYGKEVAEGEGWRLCDETTHGDMQDKWGSHENPDPEEISRDWAAVVSEVPYDGLIEAAQGIARCAEARGVCSASSWTRVK